MTYYSKPSQAISYLIINVLTTIITSIHFPTTIQLLLLERMCARTPLFLLSSQLHYLKTMNVEDCTIGA